MIDEQTKDRAWAALPAELRKTAQLYYDLEPESEYAKGYNAALKLFFGRHNLTSDTEPDEMVCVSRAKVMGVYAYNDDILRFDPTHNGAKLLKAKLQELFGSKCLPDESESPKLSKVGKDCNVDSLPTNVDSLDESKAEPKIQVGDRVRCLNDREVYIVMAKVGKYHYALQGVEHDVHESLLEPYTEPTQKKRQS